ncbi:hypothetical protein ACS18Q_16890 [Vibrio sp. Vf1514]|uniref:hypothetical protein n=1 Tax=Vibrio sp. Vf1514 TaxID=3437381 RepID=UPI003F8987A6
MNDVMTRLWHHPAAPRCYTLVSLLLCVGLMAWLQAPTFTMPQTLAFNQLSCSAVHTEQRADPALPNLTILIPAHFMARPLLSTLCSDPMLNHRFRDVTVQWLPRGELTPRMIYQQDFDVMWGRDYHLAGLSPDYQRYYEILLRMPQYDALWFAREPITPQFLATHRIGLLSDTFSRSGYQLPVQVLAQLSIDIHAARVTRYPSRQAMLSALTKGEVDVIPDTNYSPLYQGDTFYQTTIAQGISAGGWYVSRSLRDEPVLHQLKSHLHHVLAAFSS